MKNKMQNGINRREFLKYSAFLGSSFLFLNSSLLSLIKAEQTKILYNLSKPENIIYSVCLQCNTGCGIKVKNLNGIVLKIDGNPYSPWTLFPHINYETSQEEVAKLDGAICPKGQSGFQTLYDPYRIVKVLKRAGKRGENKWKTIPFEQAIDEIVQGGYLFKEVQGEETRYVEGLKDIYALRNPDVAKEMATDISKIWKKKMTVDEFKKKHKDYLNTLIDPNHPDLGPKNNQFVYMWGRKKGGRSDFAKRFFSTFGSINTHGHTTVCQGSLYFTSKAMSEQFIDNHFTGGEKFYWQADTENSKFILFIGANLFEANYGPSNRSVRLMENIVSGKTKIAVIDPRFSKLASKAYKWIPIEPGKDAPFGLGMIRWIIENERYDKKYLENSNKAASKIDKEPTFCNATWLVKIENGEPKAFLRASEIGLIEKEIRKNSDGKEYEHDLLIVSKNGKFYAFDPNDENNPQEGDLFVSTRIKNIEVKSALQILKEEAFKRTINEYAKEAGVSSDDIVEMAKEFTNYGKSAAIDIHRGVSQHTNGFYNVFTFYALNLLIGNYDWKGGMIKLSAYDAIGKKANKPYNLSKMLKEKIEPFGISIIRHNSKYEETTLFEGYPAKRNWYPMASDIYQEIIPSIGDAYPYPIKALFLYMGSPTYSLPRGDKCAQILSDTNKVPLFFTSDIIIGTTSIFADYIFPDLSYLERWEFHGSHPNISSKSQPIRQPAVAPLTETVQVFQEEIPLSFEAVLLKIAEKLNMPNFGKNALGEGFDLIKPEDFYLRMVANVAYGEKEDGSESVPDASPAEIEIFKKARRHLPKTVYDEERWRKIVGNDLWKKVIFVLNRGGRFQDYEKSYDGDYVANKYGKLINMYQEKTQSFKNAITGKNLKGYPTYYPIQTLKGENINNDGYPFKLITNRTILMTKSRTITNYYLLQILQENFILINPEDAKKINLKDGDKVKVVSSDNSNGLLHLPNLFTKSIIGKVKLSETIKPGVITFYLGYGHWATGAEDATVDGKTIKGDKRRATGIHCNSVFKLEPYLKNTALLDPVGASVSFYDSYVNLVKI